MTRDFTVTDVHGFTYAYQTSSMRAALAIHDTVHGTDVVRAELRAVHTQHCLAESPKDQAVGGLEPFLCTLPAGHNGEHQARHPGTGQSYAVWGQNESWAST